MKLINQIMTRRILMNHINDKLPIAVGYKIMKVLKSTDDDETFFQNKMKEITNTYGQTDPNGKLMYSKEGNVIIQNGKRDECNALIKELEDNEVEQCKITFTLEELAPIQFSVNELFILEPYIEQANS